MPRRAGATGGDGGWRTHLLLAACLAAQRAAPVRAAACLDRSDGGGAFGEDERRNITVGSQSGPLGIWQLNWASSKIASNIMKIIAEEILGYNVKLDTGLSSGGAVHTLAGCTNSSDCSAEAPAPGEAWQKWHLSFEVWESFAIQPLEQWQAIRPENKPESLGTMGYYGKEGEYIKQTTKESGLIKGLDLREDYAYKLHPAEHFDSIESISLDRLLPCSAWTQTDQRQAELDLDRFAAHFPSELGVGVQLDGSGSHAPVCAEDGKWWLAPKCRSGEAPCVPYIAHPNGWGAREMMQRAVHLDIPIAVGIAFSELDWEDLVRNQRVMNYWWFPDERFLDSGLERVRFEAHNPTEWADKLRVTSRKNESLLKLRSRDLSPSEPYTVVASNLKLKEKDMTYMMKEILGGAPAEDVACWWLRNESEQWNQWVPQNLMVPLTCQGGYGVVDASGQPLLSPNGAVRCKICEKGRYATPYKDGSPYQVCTHCPKGKYQATEGQTSCTVCQARGKVQDIEGQTSCTVCDPGKYMSDTGSATCEECPRSGTLLPGTHTEEARTRCQLEPGVVAFCCLAMLLNSIASILLGLTARRRLQVYDVHEWDGATILTTATPHRLVRFGGKKRAFLYGSPHPKLKSGGPFWVKWHSRRSLELQCKDGSPLQDVETSTGILVLDFPWGIMYTGWHEVGRFATVFYLVLLLVAGSVTSVVVLLKPQSFVPIVGFGYVVLSLAPFVVTLAIVHWYYRYQNSSPLQGAVLDFKALLHIGDDSRPATKAVNAWSAPAPNMKRMFTSGTMMNAFNQERAELKSTPMGPQRAVSAGQLSDFLEFFRSFIRMRKMYYVVDEIIKPITFEAQLSYAETVGGAEVEWFVSHYWGDPFNEFVRSIRTHAMDVTTAQNDGEPASSRPGAPATEWRKLRYWVCSFSINQWKASEETGETPTLSSFYKALRHSTCVGTVMVIQDSANPLTRSWCLFELLQTFNLKRDRPNDFSGLTLATHSGVLNSGTAPVDAVLKIAIKIITMSVRDAQATQLKDKKMIDDAVESGIGFEDLNKFLREHMQLAILSGKDRLDSKIQMILERLKVTEKASVEDADELLTSMPFSSMQDELDEDNEAMMLPNMAHEPEALDCQDLQMPSSNPRPVGMSDVVIVTNAIRRYSRGSRGPPERPLQEEVV